jgi:hypothetical protein
MLEVLLLRPPGRGYWLLRAMKHKSELLHFGYVTQWEIFSRAVYMSLALFYDDTSIPRQFFMYPRFSSVDSGHVWLLIRGYMNQLSGQTPTVLRVGSGNPDAYNQFN